VQTSTPPSYSNANGSDEDDENKTLPTSSVGRETEDEMRQRLLRELEAEHAVLDAELAHEIAEIPEDERQAILEAPEFSSFLDEASKIVQRALSDNYDYIRDYRIEGDGLQ
jgi:dynein intermediate chain